MGAAEVEAFLTYLAVNENVAASTQNQALSALLSLYREVLKKDPGPIDALRAKKPKRMPTVLTKDEVRRVLDHPTCPTPWSVNTPMPTGSGSGDMSSPRSGCRWTSAAASCAVTTWTKVACKRPCALRPSG
jgi:hypothetical protein